MLADLFEAGTLAEPGAATRYEFATVGGMVTVEASWTGSLTLELSVNCPGESVTRLAETGAIVRVASIAGRCSIGLANPATATTASRFEVVVTHFVDEIAR